MVTGAQEVFLRPLLLALGLSACSPFAGPTTPPESITVRSDAIGDTFAVDVYVPAVAGPWELVVVLDGATAGAPLAGHVEREGLPLLVVAVGYDEGVTAERRLRDLTFVAEPGLDTPTGGGEAFLSLLLDQVLPQVAAAHDVDPARRWLLGHSLGGLFALHVAFTQDPGDPWFEAVVAASPALFRGSGHVLDDEASAPTGGTTRWIATSYGELEGAPIAAYTGLLAERLAAREDPGLRVRHMLLDDRLHDDTWWPTYTRNLRWIREGR